VVPQLGYGVGAILEDDLKYLRYQALFIANATSDE
jgi:hypothetical protein